MVASICVGRAQQYTAHSYLPGANVLDCIGEGGTSAEAPLLLLDILGKVKKKVQLYFRTKRCMPLAQ